VNPSDTAPALVALDAQMVIRGPKGERVVNAEDYWIGPGVDITRMNVLAPAELLVAIRIPATMSGAQFYFEKVRDRQVWDFPLVNVAAAIQPTATTSAMRARRQRGGGDAARLKHVEAAVVGKPRNEETAKMAGDLAVQGRRRCGTTATRCR
jgi:xanthine dehydrogenase YagS FAD-binding subunit